jgi:hypothetical protein
MKVPRGCIGIDEKLNIAIYERRCPVHLIEKLNHMKLRYFKRKKDNAVQCTLGHGQRAHLFEL